MGIEIRDGKPGEGMAYQRLPPVAGVEIEDMPTLDAIERAHAYLDQADEAFREGSRAGGMFMLGKAAHLLEALGAGEGE